MLSTSSDKHHIYYCLNCQKCSELNAITHSLCLKCGRKLSFKVGTTIELSVFRNDKKLKL